MVKKKDITRVKEQSEERYEVSPDGRRAYTVVYKKGASKVDKIVLKDNTTQMLRH